jgi:hypothetical protein
MADDNIMKKIGDGLVDIAPTIGAILTATGVGAPVGMAINALASLGKAFGLGESATPDAIQNAIATDPQAALKIALAEQDYKLKMRELDIEELKTQIDDTKNARQMSTDKVKTTGKSDLNLYILSWTIIFGFFALITILLFVILPTAQEKILYMLLGTLASGFMLVLQFFYGSNRSSESKTDMIYNSTPNVPKKEV